MPILSIISFVLGNWKQALWAFAVVGGLGWLAYEHHKIYTAGEAAAVQKVEKANAAAKSAADNAQADVDACYARGPGFTWDRASGVCHGPAR